MKCENDKTQLTSWINHEMTDAERVVFEAHLAECTECAQELEAMQLAWNLLDEMVAPEPSADMTARFRTMLNTYKETQTEKKSWLSELSNQLRSLWTLQPGMQLAYSVILIVIGVGVGYLFNRQGDAYESRQQVAALSSQVHEMKEMMMMSLLENPSASERIRGVSYTTEVNSKNKKEMFDALFSTLNNDPNVNVRLATLEALTHFSNEAAVREGLVQSIVQQESPMLQSAMADAMLKLQEKRAVQSFRKILEQKDLDRSVRTKIEETITKLI